MLIGQIIMILVTDDDGTCYKEGCTEGWADNYDEYATIDDGLCELNACMSNGQIIMIIATVDDGSCYRRDACQFGQIIMILSNK